MTKTVQDLNAKARWLRIETLRIHRNAPETRIASGLSCVEILAVLYYGGILRHKPTDPSWAGRDRLVISKGHGGITLYPILAELGYLEPNELAQIGRPGSRLGSIPDATIPGFETTNGSMGHGLGLACGMALGLKKRHRDESVFVLCGDGELFSGAMWEAVMLTGQLGLDNLCAIVDNNQRSMLDDVKNIVDMAPLPEKFAMFKWSAAAVDGHDVQALHTALGSMRKERQARPKVLVANTIKGKGIPSLETDPLCHTRTLSAKQVEDGIKSLS